MKSIYLLVLLITTFSFAQDDNNTKYQLSVTYGPQYNNFVDYDRDLVTRDGYIIPLEGLPGESALLQKREIGTYFNATFSLRLGGRNYLELGHSRTLNQGVYNGIVFFQNNTIVEIEDFQLRHRNLYYKLGYKRIISKNFSAHLGIAHADFQQEVINIFPGQESVEISERNAANSNFSEGFVYLGAEYDLYTSGKFTLGVRSTAYIIISAGTELETFTVSPTLRFNF